jgi:hypothetical protein
MNNFFHFDSSSRRIDSIFFIAEKKDYSIKKNLNTRTFIEKLI